ncbi:hypothetical protein V7123_18610 [Bacillus toyonensis]|uniref:Restriction endonuclease type IV Mrr domain-containing protein n=1 Tax=Bacillus toyonensis TaxID=155322 RepID=A0ABX6G518_9BACI|nr:MULTISPECIES: hypothetical protein [Bacillus]EJQ85275.1 hypothetical protein IGK_00159 [Bacillus toyonensis]EJQ91403.1 hypothetical protein IGO_00725 [Bacillus toyonensis]KAB2387573.1 hypothetical protein F8507_06180 [Bacillus toyonensis]MBY7101859.1 hypothetical protein [Bacillus sp. 6YEL31]MCG3796323.1 hypothetical protein [Bacillus toyonensis]
MLFEGEVIEFVCNYLAEHDFEIIQKLSTKEQGDDIVALKSGMKLIIEAKGESSSNKNSNRYGQPFNYSQVKTHVGVAVYKILEILTREMNDGNAVVVGMALPNNENHRKCVTKISLAIKPLNIVLFWVNEDGSVDIEGNLI